MKTTRNPLGKAFMNNHVANKQSLGKGRAEQRGGIKP